MKPNSLSKSQKLRGFLLFLYAVPIFCTSVVITALVVLFIRRKDKTRHIHTFQRVSRVWIRCCIWLCGVRLRCFGYEHYVPGTAYIYTPNHRSMLDVIIESPFLPSPHLTLGKDSFRRVPFFSVIYCASTILVRRKDPKSRIRSLYQLKEALSKNISVCLYPEGGRNKTREPLTPFQNGAFKLAQETDTPVLPVLLKNTDKILPLSGGLLFPGTVEMHLLPPMRIAADESISAFKERVFKTMKGGLDP